MILAYHKKFAINKIEKLFSLFGQMTANMKFLSVICSAILITISISSCAANNLSSIKKLYDAYMYPNQIPILNNPSLALDFISNDIVYRFRGGAVIKDFNVFIDYFYGTSPYQADAVLQFTNYTIRRFVSNGKIAAVTVDVNVTPTPGSPVPASITSETAFVRFDQNGKIIQYDAVQDSADVWYKLAGLNTDYPIIIDILVGKICTAHNTYCTGQNNQFPNNTTNCTTYVKGLPVGSGEEANMDNIICRVAWSGILQRNPSLYCPTIGSATNELCSNSNTYESFYNDPFPQNFLADGATGKV